MQKNFMLEYARPTSCALQRQFWSSSTVIFNLTIDHLKGSNIPPTFRLLVLLESHPLKLKETLETTWGRGRIFICPGLWRLSLERMALELVVPLSGICQWSTSNYKYTNLHLPNLSHMLYGSKLWSLNSENESLTRFSRYCLAPGSEREVAAASRRYNIHANFRKTF